MKKKPRKFRSPKQQPIYVNGLQGPISVTINMPAYAAAVKQQQASRKDFDKVVASCKNPRDPEFNELFEKLWEDLMNLAEPKNRDK